MRKEGLLTGDTIDSTVPVDQADMVAPNTGANVEAEATQMELLKKDAEECQETGTAIPSSGYQLHQEGCDDYYKRLSEEMKERLSSIAEYVSYIMAPFIAPADMEAFTNEILSFATDAGYKLSPWEGLNGTLTSFDVRHLVWNITARLGLGKGMPYSTDVCARFIMDMFPDICEGLDFSTLRNLRVTSHIDKIHLDEPWPDCFDFHIPRQG